MNGAQQLSHDRGYHALVWSLPSGSKEPFLQVITNLLNSHVVKKQDLWGVGGFLLVCLVLIETWRVIDKTDPEKREEWLKNHIESENSCKRERSVSKRNLIVTLVNTTQSLKGEKARQEHKTRIRGF